MPTARITWNMLVTVVSAPVGATSIEAYPWPDAGPVRCEALYALAIRAAKPEGRHLVRASASAPSSDGGLRSRLAARGIRMSGSDTRRGRITFAPEAGRVALAPADRRRFP